MTTDRVDHPERDGSGSAVRPMPQPSITELLDRLAALEDERAIMATLHAYGQALDYGDRALFLDCFTADAELVVHIRLHPEAGFRHAGEELGRFFDEHTHAPALYHKHITTTTRIDRAGSSATAASYFMRVDMAPGPGQATPITWGRYLDQLERDEGARWRISSRRAEVENV